MEDQGEINKKLNNQERAILNLRKKLKKKRQKIKLIRSSLMEGSEWVMMKSSWSVMLDCIFGILCMPLSPRLKGSMMGSKNSSKILTLMNSLTLSTGSLLFMNIVQILEGYKAFFQCTLTLIRDGSVRVFTLTSLTNRQRNICFIMKLSIKKTKDPTLTKYLKYKYLKQH